MLVNSQAENKMTLQNLAICLAPALKLEMPVFGWLIGDWKNCWKGCATERDYLEREYAILDKDPEMVTPDHRSRPVQHFDRYLENVPKGDASGNSHRAQSNSPDRRPATSPGGAIASGERRGSEPSRPKFGPRVEATAIEEIQEEKPANIAGRKEGSRPQSKRQLAAPELSPVQPLSPMGNIDSTT